MLHSRRQRTLAGVGLAVVLVARLPALLPEQPGATARRAAGEPARHWAYAPPARPRLPAVRDGSWPRNQIDRFVLARLEREGLAPSPRAEPARLLRRVFLDLVGLPPSPAEVDAFLADPSPAAYERAVDALLASPRYGERWARPWLDLARYADSNGFQRDGHREIWAYRDWVVRALDADMPFDRFTIEQLAGDLLPDASLEQRLATGFHRCTTVNVEAGVDQEEDRINAVFDRVNTTGTVWLGTTIECAQCHEHKYDPFDQRDYYRLFAFFNNTPLETKGGAASRREFIGPRASLPLSEPVRLERRRLEAACEELETRLETLLAEHGDEQATWEVQTRGDPERIAEVPEKTRAILLKNPEARDDAEREQLRAHFLELVPEIKRLRGELTPMREALAALEAPSSLVMVESETPRVTRVFERGDFQRLGEVIEPGTPAALHAFPTGVTRDRLGLARWIVSSANPLTARVTVNRAWAELFGFGIVASLEDLGTQSEPPTHPRLLDWLAVELIERGWSLKALHRMLVTSATYCQSSRVTPQLLERDPENRLLARAARFRLDAERIRDNALAIAGALSLKRDGPPVRPPQPDGIWRVTGVVDNTYRVSEGEDRYRRGLYVVWRRSSPYPSFVAFDAPDRASCVVSRPRTNTALQALTLLNDPVFVELAAALARRMAGAAAQGSLEDGLRHGFRLCVARAPSAKELDILERALGDELSLRGIVIEPSGSAAGAETLAAWESVAILLLNLDETITRG